MRKVSVSRPTPAVAGLHLPLDYIAHHLRVPVASLLQVDQKTIELVFPLLLGQLGLTQLGELVAMRADQRMDAQMAPKVGSSANALATQAKALEEEYQSTFKQLVLTQATSLGFKGITNPDLRTLAADKKLTLRLIDHLAKRCFGPPTTAHTTGRDAGSETTARPPPPKRGQAIDATPHPAAGERRATTNHEQLQHREQQQPPRRDAPSSRPSPAPSTREDARAIRPAASQLRQPPSRRHRAAEEEEEEEPVNYEEDEFEGARSPPSDHGLEGEEDEDAPPSPVAPSTFDGRFAEEEFSPLAAAAAAAAAAGSSSRPPHQQQRSAPGSSRGGAPSSRDRLAAGRKKSTVLPDDQLTADELRAELRAERARHHATALQLQSLTGMYEQLLTERGEEKFGARRVTLLKAQNMQQERQLALLSEGIDARRTALAEIATIASGLEHAVSASTSGAPPEPNTHEAATTHKAQKRLAHLEQSLEAARQRLSKYQRCELQFSAHEESFLQAGAPLSAHALYSGAVTHLNLDRVHALESSLASLHEKMHHAHAMLSALAAVAPVHQQLQQFLHRGTRAHTAPASGTVLRMQGLLDCIRAACFDLQSLGVLLPSATAFPGASHEQPPGSQRDWAWIYQLQQALQRKGVSAQATEKILARATQEEAYTRTRLAMLEEELQYHRRVQRCVASSLVHLVRRCDEVVGRFDARTSDLYAEAERELAHCVDDWQRNSHTVSVQRLLTTLQAIFPILRQLLQHDHHHRRDDDDDDEATRASSSPASGLPSVAAQLQASLDEALREFQQRLVDLEQQQQGHEREIAQQPATSPGATDSEVAPRRVPARSEERSQLRSSAGRNATRAEAELPPFQF